MHLGTFSTAWYNKLWVQHNAFCIFVLYRKFLFKLDISVKTDTENKLLPFCRWTFSSIEVDWISADSEKSTTLVVLWIHLYNCLAAMATRAVHINPVATLSPPPSEKNTTSTKLEAISPDCTPSHPIDHNPAHTPPPPLPLPPIVPFSPLW